MTMLIRLRKLCQTRRRQRMRTTYGFHDRAFRPFRRLRPFSGLGDSCTMSPRCHEKVWGRRGLPGWLSIPRLDRLSESLMKCCSARGAGVGRLAAWAVTAALLWSGASAAEEGKAVGKAASPAGTLLARSGKAWRVLPPK